MLSICFILNLLLTLYTINEQKYICSSFISTIFTEGRATNLIGHLLKHCSVIVQPQNFRAAPMVFLLRGVGRPVVPPWLIPSVTGFLTSILLLQVFVESEPSLFPLDCSTKELLLLWRHAVLCSAGSEFPYRPRKHMLMAHYKAEAPQRCLKELYT